MKKIFSALLILVSIQSSADDFKLSKVCDPSSEKLKFAEKMREKIVDEFKSIKKDSPKWKKFEESEMFEWIVLTYPEVLPSFAARPLAQACAAAHVQFLVENDAAAAAEKMTVWKECIETGYRETPPDTFTALVKCYETPTPSK